MINVDHDLSVWRGKYYKPRHLAAYCMFFCFFLLQVVPAMKLLRKRLGMRPTDVRRVIKKAPEVLTPRADGSTAAEAVDVSIDSLIRVKKAVGVSID